MRPRISIAMLLGAMMPIAVVLAALANPTAFWESAIFLLALVMLFSAILGVCYRRQASRAFWVGFSLFGWGFYLLSSDAYLSVRPGASVRFSFNTADDKNDTPVTVLIRNLVDTLQLNRAILRKYVGEKIQVQWGAGSYYYPSSVTEIKENQYKIRYDSDPQGIYDEWVGMNRIKSDGRDRCYRIAEMIFMLIFALVGGVIALYFVVTRRSSEPGEQSVRSSMA